VAPDTVLVTPSTLGTEPVAPVTAPEVPERLFPMFPTVSVTPLTGLPTVLPVSELSRPVTRPPTRPPRFSPATVPRRAPPFRPLSALPRLPVVLVELVTEAEGVPALMLLAW